MSESADDMYDAAMAEAERERVLLFAECECPVKSPGWYPDEDGIYTCSGCGMKVEW